LKMTDVDDGWGIESVDQDHGDCRELQYRYVEVSAS
jgi:hypothetical protein